MKTEPHPSALPHPALQPPSSAPVQPDAANATPARPQPKRNDTASTRLTETHRDTALDADGLFFEQLLMPVSAGQGDTADSQGDSSDSPQFGAAQALPTQLIDELALQLPARGNCPFSATILMPNLGEVQVQALKSGGRWGISLGFKRRHVFERMRRQHSACEAALAKALDHDVELTLHTGSDA